MYCNIAGPKISSSKTEVLHLFETFFPMFSASWWSIIEAGGEIQVSERLRVTEGKTKNWMLNWAKQVTVMRAFIN